MILSRSPRSLGRRRGEVGVVGVVVIVFGVGVVLVRVLLLGAPWRTVIRHPVIGGDVLLEGVVGRQFVLAGRRTAWKLDGQSDIFFVNWKRRG